MSDAKVTFETLDYKPAQQGDEARFTFCCPKQKGWNDSDVRCAGLLIAGRSDIKRDGQGGNGGRPQWDWDGNREAPTFSPSINCQGCWHGYIRNGRCVDTAGNDEPEPVAR